jgi:hypothetical protein
MGLDVSGQDPIFLAGPRPSPHLFLGTARPPTHRSLPHPYLVAIDLCTAGRVCFLQPASVFMRALRAVAVYVAKLSIEHARVQTC